MEDVLCTLLGRCDEDTRNEAAKEVLDYLSDPTDENLRLAMQSIVGAAESCGVGRTTINTSTLRYSFVRLRAMNPDTWKMFLGVPGLEFEVIHQALRQSPFADDGVVIIEVIGDQMVVGEAIASPPSPAEAKALRDTTIANRNIVVVDREVALLVQHVRDASGALTSV